MNNAMVQVDSPMMLVKPSLWKRFRRRWRKERQLWIIAIPMIIWVLIFAYYPMYGLLEAFVNYTPGTQVLQDQWVGLQYFQEFFTSPDFWNVLRNTLVISGLGIVFGFPAPIILALLLNELKNQKFKRVIQTLGYLPYFISWVVVANIVFTFLGNYGVLNSALMALGIIKQPIQYLAIGPYFWIIITVVDIWKNIGFSSIIYLSAIAGIDTQLYEAGKVDGLSRFGSMWHITLPGIRPTIIVLAILGIGGILNAGFEQQLLFGNPMTRHYWEVIDTYSYEYGIQLGNFSYGVAVGLFKSIIGVILVYLTNRVSKKAFDTSII